jgi:lysophospholipase L1-like esterase
MRKYILLLFVLLFYSCSPIKNYKNTASVFEKEILNLEKLDSIKQATKEDLLFIGSSSVRLWNEIERDMSPYNAIKRGYGGAHYYDLIHFIERLVVNHSPKAILIFVANDITGSEDIFKSRTDLSPEEVKRLFEYCFNLIRKIHKDIPVYVIETTPTPSRWNAWDKISKANNLIRSYCEKNPNLYFIGTRNRFIGKDGLPKKSLFTADELHLNELGYKLWSEIIKSKLSETNI